ncbi:MAG: flavin reductase family protein, partial [Patescibacteria group bacterium]|nr:flavin reductase family protein [Patescibacteria group bacterium]
VSPPVISNCPISFECKVVEMKEFGDHFLVVGQVLNEWSREKKFTPLLHYSGDIFMSPKIL